MNSTAVLSRVPFPVQAVQNSPGSGQLSVLQRAAVQHQTYSRRWWILFSMDITRGCTPLSHDPFQPGCFVFLPTLREKREHGLYVTQLTISGHGRN